MRRLPGGPTISRITAALVAGTLAATTLVPLAHAQGEAKQPAAATEAKQPDKKTTAAARKAYEAGKNAFDDGDFEAAYGKFKEANDLVPSPQAQYWLALTLDKQGKVEEAVAAYQAFLDNPDAGQVGETQLAEAKARHTELKAQTIARINVTTTPAGAAVTVDGEPQPGTTPMSLELKPGEHKLVVTADGHVPKEVALSVEGGQTLEESVELTPEPEPVPEPAAAPPPPAEPAAQPPPPPAEERSKVPAYVTLGVAGAGAIVGTIFGIMALSKKSDYDDNPTAETADDVERNALISDMAFGVAITLGVTGIVLLTSPDVPQEAARPLRPHARQASVQVAPYLSPTGGGAAARLTF
jgi:hypothetical protein